MIGVASDWLELDSPDDWVRHDCEIVLKQELAYAAYLGVTTVVLPPPIERLQAASYGRAIQAVLNSSLYLQLVIRLPLFDPNVLSSNRRTSVPTPVPSPGFFLDSPGSSALSSAGSVSERRSKVLGLSSAELSTTWEVWDTIRSICGYHPRLSIGMCYLRSISLCYTRKHNIGFSSRSDVASSVGGEDTFEVDGRTSITHLFARIYVHL